MLKLAPPPDTLDEAQHLNDVKRSFVIVAHRVKSPGLWDRWVYTWQDDAQTVAWKEDMERGVYTCCHQKRGDGVVLLGKRVRW